MNIDNLTACAKHVHYLNRIEGPLSGHGLTSTYLTNYKRCGRSYKDGNSKPDTIHI